MPCGHQPLTCLYVGDLSQHKHQDVDKGADARQTISRSGRTVQREARSSLHTSCALFGDTPCVLYSAHFNRHSPLAVNLQGIVVLLQKTFHVVGNGARKVLEDKLVALHPGLFIIWVWVAPMMLLSKYHRTVFANESGRGGGALVDTIAVKAVQKYSRQREHSAVPFNTLKRLWPLVSAQGLISGTTRMRMYCRRTQTQTVPPSRAK